MNTLRWLIIGAALAFFPGTIWGQGVKLPKEVTGQPGAWVVIVPESKDGGKVKWRAGPGLTLVPIDKLFPNQEAAGIVVMGPAGRYEVWAWNAKGDVASELATTAVVIGQPGPIPPPVPPGPDPPPPVPPGPVPPDPNDPLAKELATLYMADKGADKKAKVKLLAELYGLGANLAQDKSIAKPYVLFQRVKDAGKALTIVDLVPFRERVAKHLDSILPKDAGADFTDATRFETQRQFLRLKAICEALP